MAIMPRVLYICNREKCLVCSYPLCYQTTDVRYAKHFLDVDEDLYIEKEAVIMAEIENMPNTDDLVMRVETKEIEMTEEQQEKAVEDIRKRKPLTEEQKADRRFWRFLDMVYKLAQMSGLYIEGHIKVRDKKTGKVWE